MEEKILFIKNKEDAVHYNKVKRKVEQAGSEENVKKVNF
jgi:hypothetical protein